jgi:hypothetical protein
MKLRELIKKWLVPGLGSYFAVDGFIKNNFPCQRLDTDIRNYDQICKALETAKNQEKIKYEDQKYLLVAQRLKYENICNNIRARNLRVNELESQKDGLWNHISNLDSKIYNKQYGPGESKDSVLNMLKFKKLEFEKLNSKYAGSKIELEKYLDSIDKQGIFDRYYDLIDSYKQFLETLTADQTVALVNIFGYYMIWRSPQTLISICIIIAGDALIEKLNLDSRYPRLSKFIKARAKFRKAYL